MINNKSRNDVQKMINLEVIFRKIVNLDVIVF